MEFLYGLQINHENENCILGIYIVVTNQIVEMLPNKNEGVNRVLVQSKGK